MEVNQIASQVDSSQIAVVSLCQSKELESNVTLPVVLNERVFVLNQAISIYRPRFDCVVSGTRSNCVVVQPPSVVDAHGVRSRL